MVGRSIHFLASDGDATESARPVPCTEPERALLLLYALSTCDEEEALDFEAHLLDCDACFDDLKALDRARLLVRDALATDSPVVDRVRTSLRGIRTRVQESPAPRQRQA